MANNLNDRPLVPSVFDRLLDDDPTVRREPPASRHQVLRELKQSVRRDLENLLNSRVRNLTWPPQLQELEGSLVGYGLPDFACTSLVSPRERDDFCRLLETVVRRFEPRLENVRVRAVNDAEPIDRVFRFRIDALLRAEPAPEPIAFDSLVKAVTGAFEVRGVS